MFMGVHIRTLSPRRAASPWLSAVAGGLFVAAVGAIWWAMWRSNRSASIPRGRPRRSPQADEFRPPDAKT